MLIKFCIFLFSMYGTRFLALSFSFSHVYYFYVQILSGEEHWCDFSRIKKDFFFPLLAPCRIPLSSTISTAFLPSNLSSLYLSPRHSTRSIFHPHLRYSLHLISVLTRKLDSLEGNRLDFSTIFTSFKQHCQGSQFLFLLYLQEQLFGSIKTWVFFWKWKQNL